MAVLVGKPAPDFKATAVINGGEMSENYTLSQFKGKKYVVLFFWPQDFTFVCPTEILAFQAKLAEFEALNTQVIGVSVDSEQSHWAWLNTPKDKGGIQGVTYPLLADFSKTVAKNYDVLAGDFDYEIDDHNEERMTFTGIPVAYRATFLIDREGIVRHQVVNDLPLGRNIDDTLRTLKALQYVEEKGEVCPANWEEGKETFKATHEGIANYLSHN
jgi:peroxiredoxin 2/4